jgi:hypothetical protein
VPAQHGGTRARPAPCGPTLANSAERALGFGRHLGCPVCAAGMFGDSLIIFAGEIAYDASR